MLIRKKHLGVIVEKTWKPLAQFRRTGKVKAKELVLFLHDALVGCLISEFFFLFLMLWLRSRQPPKVMVPFS